MNSDWQKSPASKPVTGIDIGKTVLVVVPAALLPWLRESIKAEAEYWAGWPSKEAKAKAAQYQALLKNLEGK